MDSGRFRELLGASGPFASVYFEDADDDSDHIPALDLKWRALRDELERQDADESITAAMEHAVLELRLPIGRAGRAVIACPAGVLVNEYLLRPAAASVVRVSELPYIVPILEFGVAHSDYLLVVDDGTGAFITSHHEAARLSEAVESNVANRISELVHNTAFGAVFLVGDEGWRSSLLAAVPDQIRKRVTSLPIAARRGGYDFEEIQRAIDTTLVSKRRGVVDTAVARFTDELGRRSGLAVEGLGAVCVALRQGTIDTMIIGNIDKATVVADGAMTTAAPTADALSELGAAPAKTVWADEALPLLAISGGASVVHTDERIAPADGIGAVLRSASASVHARR
jgi:peptide chain release factor subunit 1